MDERYNDWLKEQEDNKLLTEKIEDIIKEEKSYSTIDEVIQKVFDKYNISLDDISDIIKNTTSHKKCDVCEYVTDYNYDYKSKTNKVKKINLLKCKNCNYVNTCKSCYDIYKYDLDKPRGYYVNVLEKCYNCNENINVSACKTCKYYRCTCGCPCGCCC